MSHALALLFALAVCLGSAREAVAASGRYAIIVGENDGDRSEVTLRYAESDARRLAEVLRTVGGFYPENILLLNKISGDDFRRAVIGLNARLRQEAGRALLFVFYSGHADAEALHLGNTRLGLSELRDLVAGSPAEARILVLDSCRSGSLTRVKGGRPIASFQIRIDEPPAAQGLAILTSSAAGEDAQESDHLRASIFTHHLLSALVGAADRDRNGRITIDEAFSYAAERTLASTAHTLPGPQHPTYRLELGGRDDLILTEPGVLDRRRGTLAFAEPGTYLIQSEGPDGAIVAELVADRPWGRLTVEVGRYFVTERNREFLRQGPFLVATGAVTTVTAAQLQRVDYARVVRKGSVARSRAFSGFVLGGVRGALLGLGTAARAELGGRLDLRPLSLELRLGLGGSQQQNQVLAISTYEVSAAVAGLHAFDLNRVTISLGIELGLSWFGQRFSAPETRARNTLAGFLAPVVQLEIPLRRRLYLRADGALLTYFLQTATSSALTPSLSYRAVAGLGVYY